jgi:uncharacterized membrane protein
MPESEESKESKTEKIAKLREELQADVDRHDRIDELRKELESYGYVVEKKEIKDTRENLSKGILSCVFWIGVMIALPLVGSGIGYSQAETSGALSGAGIGAGLGLVLMLIVQKLYDVTRASNGKN